jgi:hypothetical protein
MDFVQEATPAASDMLAQTDYMQTPDLSNMPQPPQPGLAQLAQTEAGARDRGEDPTWFEQPAAQVPQAPTQGTPVPPDPLAAPAAPQAPAAPAAPQAPAQPLDQTQAMLPVVPQAPAQPADQAQGILPLPPANPQILDEDD